MQARRGSTCTHSPMQLDGCISPPRRGVQEEGSRGAQPHVAYHGEAGAVLGHEEEHVPGAHGGRERGRRLTFIFGRAVVLCGDRVCVVGGVGLCGVRVCGVGYSEWFGLVLWPGKVSFGPQRKFGAIASLPVGG